MAIAPQEVFTAIKNKPFAKNYDSPCTGHATRTFRKVHANIAQTPPEPDTLGGWGPQAELVDQSLPAYTPAPSNPSFMGALVP